MQKIIPFAAIGVLIFINTLVVSYFMRTKPPVFSPYNDNALRLEIDAIKSVMHEDIETLHTHIDSLNKTLVESNNEIQRKVNNINSLKKQLDAIESSIDYSNMSNDSLQNEITDKLK